MLEKIMHEIRELQRVQYLRLDNLLTDRKHILKLRHRGQARVL